MKSFMLCFSLLFSFMAHAAGDNGYVKKVVEDDEGAKIVLSKTLTDTKAEDIKTIYLSNTQTNFEQTKQALLDSKNSNTRVNVLKDSTKTLTVRQLGQ